MALPALTADSLTEALGRAGRLHPPTRVIELTETSSRTTVVSAITRLAVRYEAGSGREPASVLVKSRRPGLDPALRDTAGRPEVDFYARVAPLRAEIPVPACYEAAWDADTGDFRLVLEDLSDTHMIVTEWPLAPTVPQCEVIVDAWARVHAAWWDDPRLGREVGTLLDLPRYLAYLDTCHAAFVEQLGDRLSADRADLLRRFVARAERLAGRQRMGRDITLVHGDAHVWNVLYPRDPARHTVRVIDWDGWRPRTASRDIAYMIAVHWYPERRRHLERRLLERYHAALVDAGVGGYPLAAFLEDYRLSVLEALTVPLFQHRAGLGAWIWWSHLERVCCAIDDLGCRELLG